MNKNWQTKKLGEICDIYQPKTITSQEILEEGPYKVFGANGVIGFYNKYNHENPEILVTCRGATCGTINLSEPKAWITGNAMVMHPKTKSISKKFLYYTLKSLDLRTTISGTAQPQITRTSLAPFRISIAPLSTQHLIVERLDAIRKAQELNNKQIELAEELFECLLSKEFNPKGKNWPKEKISKVVLVAGNKFVPKKIQRSEYQTIGSYPVVDQGANLISGHTDEKEFLYKGALPIVLFGDHTRIIKFIDFPFAIGADGTKILISNDKNVLPKYLYYALLGIKIENFGYKRHFSILREKWIDIPSIETQKQIVKKLSAVQEYKKKLLEQKGKLRELFDSCLDKAMKGELVK